MRRDRIKPHSVAIVVFASVEAISVDAAVNVASLAVAEHLQSRIDSGGLRGFRLGEVVELGGAVGRGLIGLDTSPDAYPS
jgi:hypothetical protein